MPILEFKNALLGELLKRMNAGGAAWPIGGDSGIMVLPPDAPDSIWDHERNHIKYGFPLTPGNDAMQSFNDLWAAGRNIPNLQMEANKYSPIIAAHDSLEAPSGATIENIVKNAPPDQRQSWIDMAFGRMPPTTPSVPGHDISEYKRKP